jgi:glycosyltransferase involved in cell wall biosynthesis
MENAYPDRPLVSVVMAVLNPHPVFFPQAVRSILAQTLGQFEFIIVEDPSSRRAQETLAAFDDPRIRHYCNPERTGLIYQRNQGLALARADLVAVFDADDISEPTRLERQFHYLLAHADVDVVGSQITVIDERGTVQGHRRFPLKHKEVLEALPRVVPLAHSCTMYRKESVLTAGGYQHEEFPHVDDYELWSRLAVRGMRFANLPEALLRYRVHPEMGKITRMREVIRGVLRVKRLYWRDRMNWRARTQMWGEHLLLGLPTWLTFRLLMWALYQDGQLDVVEDSPALSVRNETVATGL